MMPTETLTPRLLLRQWVPEDIPALSRIVKDAEVVRYMFGRPLTDDEVLAAYSRRVTHWERHGFGFWAVETQERPGHLIGWAGLQYADWFQPADPPVEAGWMLARESWGSGLATEAAAHAVRLGFEVLGLPRIEAYHHPDNGRSQRVMEKLGMRFLGDGVSPKDGSPIRIRELTREQWAARTGHQHELR